MLTVMSIEMELTELELQFDRKWDTMLAGMGTESEHESYYDFLNHYETIKEKELQLDSFRLQ